MSDNSDEYTARRQLDADDRRMIDLERMAREAGLVQYAGNWCSDQADGIEPAELARFADLIRADEREKCAKVVDSIAVTDMTGYGVADDCAAAIRASS
jgi:hypothetical protein